MVQAVTKYVTSDNKRFDTQSEAEAHEYFLKNSAKLDKFLADSGLVKANATKAINNICAYLAWVEKQPAAAEAA